MRAKPRKPKAGHPRRRKLGWIAWSGLVSLSTFGFGKILMDQHSLSSRSPALAAESYLDLIVVPPYKNQNWKTPRALLLSQLKILASIGPAGTIRKRARKSSMGHGVVHFKCEGSAGPVEEWSGFSGDGSGKGTRLVFKEKAGMGALLYEFADGYVQSPEYVRTFLVKASNVKRARPHIMRIPISREQCDMLACHLKTFRGVKNPTYGFTNEPLQYTGAGCTSYAASYIQSIGAFHPEFRRWIRRLEISSRLVGTSSLQPELGQVQIDEKQPRGVKLGRILGLFRKSRWKFKGYQNYQLEIFDPQHMVGFIRDVADCVSDDSRCKDDALRGWVREVAARTIPHEHGHAIELTGYRYLDAAKMGTSVCRDFSVAREAVMSASDERLAALPDREEQEVAAPPAAFMRAVENLDEASFERLSLEAAQRPESVPHYEAGNLEEVTRQAREEGKLFFYLEGELYSTVDALTLSNLR